MFRSPLLVLVLSACSPADKDAAPGDLLMGSAERDTSPGVDDATMATFTADNRAFAFDFYHEVATGSGNVFFSPHSLSEALAMTWAGAAGDTATAMASTMHYTLPPSQVHAAFDQLDLSLTAGATDDEGNTRYELSNLNALFGQKNLSFEEDFLNLLSADYGAGMHVLDFAADPEGSRGAINTWVSDATNARIPELLSAGSIDGNTRLVLANAIYFKAAWTVPFDVDDTTDADFTHLDGSVAAVPTLHGSIEGTYAAGDGWTAATLPIGGNGFDLTVVMPDAGRFAEVEASLDDSIFVAATSGTYSNVVLALPKFSFGSTVDAYTALVDLGMGPAMDPSAADFSGMTKDDALYIGGVAHQGFVGVDEVGVEAAAATAVDMAGTAMPESVTFTVDRPFFLFLSDPQTGALLFAGRVTEP